MNTSFETNFKQIVKQKRTERFCCAKDKREWIVFAVLENFLRGLILLCAYIFRPRRR